MASLRDVINCGDIREVLIVCARMQELPEYGPGPLDEKVAEQAGEIARLEAEGSRLRLALRENADRILDKARRHWTAKEIEEATGYPPE